MARWLIAAAAGLFLAAPALSGIATGTSDNSAAAIDQLLAGRVAGKPQDCVALSRIDGPQIIDHQTLLYTQSGRRVWRNDLPSACPGLHADDIVIVEAFGANLCRGDHFRTVSRSGSIPSAPCRLGIFTPYDKAKPAAAAAPG